MLNDHKVRFRAYDTIMQLIMNERRKRNIDHLCSTDFRKVVESYVSADGSDKKKPLLVLFDGKRCYAATERDVVSLCAQGRSSSIFVMRWPATILASTSDR
jgi:hypothetical protein